MNADINIFKQIRDNKNDNTAIKRIDFNLFILPLKYYHRRRRQ